MGTADGTSSLRVAQLIETLDMGGAERLAVQIANARAAAGDASHLYVLTDPGPLSAAIAPEVRVRYFGYRRVPIGRPWAFLVSLRRGWRLLSEQAARDGIAIIQTHLPAANFWGLLLQWRGRCAAVPTVHNNREFDYGEADAPLRRRLRRRAYAEMLRRCPAIVAVSERVRASLLTELGAADPGPERLLSVPNGVPEPPPRDDAYRAAVRERHGVGADESLVLAAGRHCEQKDFRTLVEAAARLRDRGVSCRVLIAGDGPLRTDLRRRARRLGLESVVLFPGNVDDLGDLMQAADIFVLSSLWEGLPLVLLEAMAAALPVVGTRIDGIGEILRDGETGRLVSPADPEVMADAVAELLADPQRRRALGEGGRDLVRERFSFARVDRDLAALYHRIAGV